MLKRECSVSATNTGHIMTQSLKRDGIGLVQASFIGGHCILMAASIDHHYASISQKQVYMLFGFPWQQTD